VAKKWRRVTVERPVHQVQHASLVEQKKEKSLGKAGVYYEKDPLKKETNQDLPFLN
jgi:hypothetical protein